MDKISNVQSYWECTEKKQQHTIKYRQKSININKIRWSVLEKNNTPLNTGKKVLILIKYAGKWMIWQQNNTSHRGLEDPDPLDLLVHDAKAD